MKYTVSIKKRGTFKYLINKGQFSRNNSLVVYFIKNNKNTNDLGICVSKKNGISVHRNKLKRWVREVYKEEEVKLKKGITIVVLYKKETKVDDLTYIQVKNELIQSFSKLNLYELNNEKK